MAPLRAVGAVNALAADVATRAGFDALWVSGLETSAALGLPDTNLIGVDDLVNVVSAVGRASALPVIVDVDNAGGSVAAAHRYAADLAQAGAAGVCLEDSSYPKCNSFTADTQQRLADRDLVGTQLAQMRSVTGRDLLLIARTEALIVGENMSAALARANAYVEAGADAVIIHSKDPSGRQAFDIARAWRKSSPLAVIPTAFPQLSAREMGAAGFALCIYANQLSRAALAGMRVAAERIADGGVLDAGLLASFGDLLRVGQPGARVCI
ncbi:MAG: isocitrate lyase/phosphoenolpyruvate mutase family protein [Pseudonocardia sp.]|nr:isocitrate lyase/phosphoenolpyruvate mutase family protein [Pseudonocardia sp.]